MVHIYVLKNYLKSGWYQEQMQLFPKPSKIRHTYGKYVARISYDFFAKGYNESKEAGKEGQRLPVKKREVQRPEKAHRGVCRQYVFIVYTKGGDKNGADPKDHDGRYTARKQHSGV